MKISDKNSRYEHIDVMRAVAMIIVIATHTFAYHLNTQTNLFIWNYIHFVVVGLVFCSGYVTAARYQAPQNIGQLLVWYKKRILRLLLPFYGYLVAHYALILLFPQLFSGLGLKLNLQYILKSLTLTGGIDLNWLPLLFVQLTLLYPLVALYIQYVPRRILYSAFALGGAVLFTYITYPYAYYRWVMWIPWSFFILLGGYLYNQDQRGIAIKKYLAIAGIAAAVFLVLTSQWSFFHRSATLTDNKYPPNLLYLSYATAWSFAILALGTHRALKSPRIHGIISYISKQSYTLFFVHYIVLDFMLRMQGRAPFIANPFVQFPLVLIVSIVITFLLSRVHRKKS